MPSREHILHRVRTALSRSAGQPAAPAPEAWLRPISMDPDQRLRLLLERFSGQAVRAGSPQEALEQVRRLVAGRQAVASPAPLLERLGILALPEVVPASGSVEEVRRICAAADIGITSAEYALADTGALVALAGPQESRLASLLPPVHVTVLETDRILSGLDELFTRLPDPGAVSSSLVLIGGPSRTADIEQILTLGVHGPREIHLVVLEKAS